MSLLADRLGASGVRVAGVAAPVTWPQAQGVYRRIAAGGDALIAFALVGSVAVAGWGSDRTVLAGAVAAALFVVAVAACGGYSRESLATGRRELLAPVKAGAAVAALGLVVDYAGTDVPPVLLLVALPLVVATVLAARSTQRAVVRRLRREGALLRRVLVVGSDGAAVARVVSAFDAARADGAVVVATLWTPSRPLTDVPELVVERGVDVVVVAGDVGETELRRMSWELERTAAQLVLVPELADLAAPRLRLGRVATLPALEVDLGARPARRRSKVWFDRVVGVVLLAAASVVLVPAALAVRLTSRGAVIFRQQRVGERGRTFTMLKLRTMVADAEARRSELETSSEADGPLFKMRRDPRLTRVGRVLRRFSIDELPQLVNVVRGDMSLVGPRPPLPSEVARYDATTSRRMHARPGLTGLWQVSGRSDLAWEQSVRLDLQYVDRATTWTDLRILASTVGAVIGGRGAY
ncbi:exopolysaccharide biosynthesis polyprenyl glycosylphosphotransferase [Beutenbergia cavernae DSM 12333]|uniref:Exopolysaccharide biosynthesis polyprenyl glycosylphosphotransferase n=1 Tax=Beutenbergia cavernae (strain ATCC BAA-8 / DSM 12333 / CCUG 43141 / JCM 11478 / NBRC 16432 / NCIMB 13614 / HKI 0122) TaxID=471853 RepID=C5C0G7_BEUC1|nr:exopolysaccharide biosynthesis polyprenyl glycosylphosphotransferase [Beutenbergia cavernae]ACQ81363.1 exopolysaccharide biosynthesis polyprenyl glycosylphosphotransferase [Beutenbergia cavernae DSM 12333]